MNGHLLNLDTAWANGSDKGAPECSASVVVLAVDCLLVSDRGYELDFSGPDGCGGECRCRDYDSEKENGLAKIH
jgi:hypothetical protein